MKNKLREQMVDVFIKSLEENIIPWEQDWVSGIAFNPVTKTRYNGTNAFWLMYQCYKNKWNDPRFCTFVQAKQKGWKIKPESKSTVVEFFSPYDKKEKKKITWAEVNRLANELSREDYDNRVSFIVSFYRVFNAEQIEGIPEYKQENTSWDKESVIALRDNLFKNMEVKFHEEGNKAFYSPVFDSITLPPIDMFKSEYGYLSTMLHESGHATGSKKRLDRNLSGGFGSPDYAREELRAEISSAFISQEIGVSNKNFEHLDNHKAYIQNWISILKNEPQELFKAIKDAESIADYLLEKSEYKKFIKVNSSIDDLDIPEDKKNYFVENEDLINQIGLLEDDLYLFIKTEDKHTTKEGDNYIPTQNLVNELNNNPLDTILESYQNWKTQLDVQDDIWFKIKDEGNNIFYCNVFERSDGDWELQVFDNNGREVDGAVCTDQDLRIDKACVTLVEMSNHTSIVVEQLNEVGDSDLIQLEDKIEEFRSEEFKKAINNTEKAEKIINSIETDIHNSKKELVSEVVKGEVIEEDTIENDKRFSMYNEKDFINDKNKFAIYQLKDSVPKEIAFESLEKINNNGFDVDRANYNLVYIGDYNPDITLEGLFETFNINRPIDFKGHSLSVSDIIVINDGVNISAHYCDDIGFKNINNFITKSKFNESIIIEDNSEIIDLDDEKSIAQVYDTHGSEEIRRERLRASHDASYQHQDLDAEEIAEEEEQTKQIS